MPQVAKVLSPTWHEFRPDTPLAAMGQAFFSLGLGGTFMLTYGSYMRREDDIPRNALLTAAMDVAAALMATVIVVPGALLFGIAPDSGPPLMFEIMPEVFRRMPAGHLFGMMFFASVFLVAMLSLIAAYEVVVAGLSHGLGWSRSRSLVVVMIAQVTLAVPALLVDSYIEISDLIWGSTMQPVGGAIAVIALVWFVRKAAALEEIRRNTRLPVPHWLYYWLKFGVPTGIVTMLVYGWVGR